MALWRWNPMTWLDYVLLGASLLCLAISVYCAWLVHPTWHKEDFILGWSPLSRRWEYTHYRPRVQIARHVFDDMASWCRTTTPEQQLAIFAWLDQREEERSMEDYKAELQRLKEYEAQPQEV